MIKIVNDPFETVNKVMTELYPDINVVVQFVNEPLNSFKYCYAHTTFPEENDESKIPLINIYTIIPANEQIQLLIRELALVINSYENSKYEYDKKWEDIFSKINNRCYEIRKELNYRYTCIKDLIKGKGRFIDNKICKYVVGKNYVNNIYDEHDNLIIECKSPDQAKDICLALNNREKLYHLWKIIDDIDTADDMCKENDKCYRNMVSKLQRSRWEVLSEEEVDLLYKDYFTWDKEEKNK